MRRAGFFIVAALLLMQTSVCYGENATDVEFLSYTLYDAGGAMLTMHGGQIWPGDEYISGDDKWYRVVSVPAPPPPGTWVPPSPTPLQWRPLRRSRARMAAAKS